MTGPWFRNMDIKVIHTCAVHPRSLLGVAVFEALQSNLLGHDHFNEGP